MPSDYKVTLEQTEDGSWVARIPSLPELTGIGTGSNQALAAIDKSFNAWYEEQSPRPAAVWTQVFHSLLALYKPEPESAPGDFWVESNCCTSCGVPQHYAPDLIGWTVEPFVSCYWKKQPETPAEFEQAFKIFQGQELDCHHYRGNDPAIVARIGGRGSDWGSGGWRNNLHTIISAHWEERTDSEPSERRGWWARLFGRR